MSDLSTREWQREGSDFVFEQYELGCLSLFSYLIGDRSSGRAIVVDPQRDVSRYIADAARLGLRIERVIETHFHADFLSGHLELAAATGAIISYGAGAVADFPIDALTQGQKLSLGKVTLEVRHTPGHTPESISVVVYDGGETAEPWAVLTGDTLFIGDVGRPDLLTSVGVTADELARKLYHSVHEQLLTLPDRTLVFPAHGAGSACGKSLSPATESTIGEQRQTNYALAPMTEDQFVEAVTQGQSVAPLYFAFAANANRAQRELLHDDHVTPLLDLESALAQRANGAMLIDTRPSDVFASGHLRGTVNVGLDGRFAEYAGNVLRPGQTVVILGDAGTHDEARIRLARIGFDNVIGALPDIEDLLLTHPDLADQAPRLTASELSQWQGTEPLLQVVDVRNPSECAEGAIAGSVNLPLPNLLDGLAELNPSRPTVIYCAGGYRSSTAASLLRSIGFVTVADVFGGYAAVSSTAAHS